MKKIKYLICTVFLTTQALLAIPNIGRDPYKHPPKDKEVFIKGPDRGISFDYYYILKDNIVWEKKRNDPDAKWVPFAHSGNPNPKHKRLPLQAISADGENILVTKENGRFDYAKNKINTNDSEHETWFGDYRSLPFKIGNFFNLTFGPFKWDHTTDKVVISHRGPHSRYYEDVVGNRHPTGIGVTNLLFLTKDHKLFFSDPWEFRPGYKMMEPEFGKFKPSSLDASASATFVMDKYGRLRTRLMDCDIDGHNPFLTYVSRFEVEKETYKDDNDYPTLKNEKDIVLSPQTWTKHPMIPLKNGEYITSAITILTTGFGNKNREMRVEGINANGVTGYWRKMINDDTWTFVETNHKLVGKKIKNYDSTLDSQSDEQLLRKGVIRDVKPSNYSGQILIHGKEKAKIFIKDLYEDAAPVKVTIETEDGTKQNLEFYQAENWHYFILGANTGTIKGFLTFPESHTRPSIKDIKSEQMRNVLETLFGNKFKRYVTINLKKSDKDPLCNKVTISPSFSFLHIFRSLFNSFSIKATQDKN